MLTSLYLKQEKVGNFSLLTRGMKTTEKNFVVNATCLHVVVAFGNNTRLDFVTFVVVEQENAVDQSSFGFLVKLLVVFAGTD